MNFGIKKTSAPLLSVVTVSVGLLLLSGCTPLGIAAGAGATVGVAAAQEGGIGGAVSDATIRVKIFDAWFRNDVELYRRLGMTVREGRVLVTGTVPTPDDRVEAIRLVWQVDGVQQVINEVRVDEQGATVGSYAQDTWITGNIKALIMFDKQVQSINYTVETVGATVYLMGIAQTQSELDRVINHARNTKYVKNVVSYVRVRGEPAAGNAMPDNVNTQPYQEQAPVQIAPVHTHPERVESVPIDDVPAGGF